MVTISCDMCKRKRLQGSNEEWILGYDLEVESNSGISRSVRFLDRWDDRRILELGAIHLCCEECRQKYLKKSRLAAYALPSAEFRLPISRQKYLGS